MNCMKVELLMRYIYVDWGISADISLNIYKILRIDNREALHDFTILRQLQYIIILESSELTFFFKSKSVLSNVFFLPIVCELFNAKQRCRTLP